MVALVTLRTPSVDQPSLKVPAISPTLLAYLLTKEPVRDILIVSLSNIKHATEPLLPYFIVQIQMQFECLRQQCSYYMCQAQSRRSEVATLGISLWKIKNYRD